MRGEFAIFFENYIFKISFFSVVLLIIGRATGVPMPKKSNNQSSRYGNLIIKSYMYLMLAAFVVISYMNTALSLVLIVGSAIVNIIIIYDAFKNYGEHNLPDNEILALIVSFNVFIYISSKFSDYINGMDASNQISQIVFIAYKVAQYYFVALCIIGNVSIFIKRMLSIIKTNKTKYSFDPYLIPDSRMLCKANTIKSGLLKCLFFPCAYIADMVMGFKKSSITLLRLYIAKPLIMLYRIVIQDWIFSLQNITETYLLRMSSKYSFMLSLLFVYIIVEQGGLFSAEIKGAYSFVSSAIILPIIITDALTYRDKRKRKETSQTS